MKSDAELKNDVDTKHSVTLTMDEGVCTLTGTVPTDSKKIEVEEAVKRVWGLEAVANELVVDVPREPDCDDAEVMQAVCAAIERCVVAPENIKVEVGKGNVMLSGAVRRQFQKEAVQDEIEKIVGVKTIVNRIAIKP
jgi:osmotically-inducible protein OsmY